MGYELAEACKASLAGYYRGPIMRRFMQEPDVSIARARKEFLRRGRARWPLSISISFGGVIVIIAEPWPRHDFEISTIGRADGHALFLPAAGGRFSHAPLFGRFSRSRDMARRWPRAARNEFVMPR